MVTVRWIADFFELRPIFSLRLVQMFWWVYATEQLYRMLWGLWITLMPKGASWQYIAFETIHVPFRVVIGLALWRLFIELMLAVLLPSARQQQQAPRTLGQDLLAFLNLRPFFTPWWLQVFWWLYLLEFLHSIYVSSLISPSWIVTWIYSDWARWVLGILDKIVWLMMVRLLAETAFKILARDSDTRPAAQS